MRGIRRASGRDEVDRRGAEVAEERGEKAAETGSAESVPPVSLPFA
jgi:hypothetical protein